MPITLSDITKRKKEIQEELERLRAQTRSLSNELKGLDQTEAAMRGLPPRAPLAHGKLIERCLKILGSKKLKSRQIAEMIAAEGYPHKDLDHLVNTVGTSMRQRPDLFKWERDTELWAKNTSAPNKRRNT
jgi:hypothetical protein